MILVEGIIKEYKNTKVLNQVNCLIKDGELIILTGRSGGGKTTLLSIIGGLTRPDNGRVLIDNIDIWQLTEPELAALRNQKIGFVFQFPSLIPTLKVLDNILLPIAFSDRSPTNKDKEFALNLLEMVGVKDKSGHYPSQLSGGQQRRVAVARAMINRPSIILTDEPTGDLDEKTEAEIMHLFKWIHQQGVTVVMVTHALNYVAFGQAYTIKNACLVPYEEAEVSSEAAGQRREWAAW